MTPPKAVILDEERAARSNTELVRECLRGDEEAWSALIDKYKRLIFSIPVKYGMSVDDATDIFQAVCVEMLVELPKLRKAEALPKWIMQITSHKCFHWKRQMQRTQGTDSDGDVPEQAVPAGAEGILREAEEEQNLRQAIAELPPRCRELIRMLFFEEPARAYQDIARTLGIATGSIGFIRQRCLEKLRRQLAESDF
ncbi:MAG TPA: sigma-70 family RNA polymerase sigma factor [Candidatus Acidoferrum sp.]|nr:sigma-70 family RNA polymerase sigma factor [Candidatus Acidoferrum sp.]